MISEVNQEPRTNQTRDEHRFLNELNFWERTKFFVKESVVHKKRTMDEWNEMKRKTIVFYKRTGFKLTFKRFFQTCLKKHVCFLLIKKQTWMNVFWTNCFIERTKSNFNDRKINWRRGSFMTDERIKKWLTCTSLSAVLLEKQVYYPMQRKAQLDL